MRLFPPKQRSVPDAAHLFSRLHSSKELHHSQGSRHNTELCLRKASSNRDFNNSPELCPRKGSSNRDFSSNPELCPRRDSTSNREDNRIPLLILTLQKTRYSQKHNPHHIIPC